MATSSFYSFLGALDLIGDAAVEAAFVYAAQIYAATTDVTNTPDDACDLSDFGGFVAVDLQQYIARLVRYIPQSHQIIDIASLLLVRLSTRVRTALKDRTEVDVDNGVQGVVKLPPSKLHRLAFTSLVVAVKLHCDDLHDNKYYASVGGVSLQQLNKMEIRFLHILDFDLFVQFSVHQRVFIALRDHSVATSSEPNSVFDYFIADPSSSAESNLCSPLSDSGSVQSMGMQFSGGCAITPFRLCSFDDIRLGFLRELTPPFAPKQAEVQLLSSSFNTPPLMQRTLSASPATEGGEVAGEEREWPAANAFKSPSNEFVVVCPQ